MKTKLLFVITQGVVGGAQKYVFDLAKHFSQSRGYDVSVAMGGDSGSDLFKKLAGEKIKTHHLKFLGRDIKMSDDIFVFLELVKLLKKEQPDIIHLNSSKIGLIGSLAAFFSKLTTNNYKPKIIFTAHGWIFKEEMPRQKRWVAVWASRLAAKFQDKIICVSENDFDKALQSKIAPPKKFYMIHNAISETKFFSRVDARDEVAKMIGQELPGNAFVVTNLGRLYANKGLNYLVEAIEELKSKLPDITLIVFGDGPERGNLELGIRNYELGSNVFLVGDKADASQYLKAFDAMVLSSTKEGFPYSILESGLAGVPVIATDVGGVGEIVKNDETGILIESKDSKAITEAILKLANNADFSQKLSASLKKSILKDFNFKTMAQKTEWVYRV